MTNIPLLIGFDPYASRKRGTTLANKIARVDHGTYRIGKDPNGSAFAIFSPRGPSVSVLV